MKKKKRIINKWRKIHIKKIHILKSLNYICISNKETLNK